jgi:hypothetical protein
VLREIKKESRPGFLDQESHAGLKKRKSEKVSAKPSMAARGGHPTTAYCKMSYELSIRAQNTVTG